MLDEISKSSNLRLAPSILAALVVGVPAGAWAGFSAQGFSAQGFSRARLLRRRASRAQGFSRAGLLRAGLLARRASAPQGFSRAGLLRRRASPRRASPPRASRCSAPTSSPSDLKGVDIGSVDIRGTTSDSGPVSIELTANPGDEHGRRDSYISVGGGSAVGHYATAHLVDANGNPAEDLDLYIAGEQARSRAERAAPRRPSQANEDVTLYEIFFFHPRAASGPRSARTTTSTGGATAMAIPEDPAHPNKFIFACTATGVAAKCARIWGYRPWRHDTTWFFDDDDQRLGREGLRH